MKKMVLVFVLCLLLVCITACGNDSGSKVTFDNAMEFASSEEMLQYLEGMWVVEDNTEDKTYYIFKNGQLYVVTDGTYTTQVKAALNNAVESGGLAVWAYQDFENVSKRIYLDDIARTPGSVVAFPQNGEIKLDPGGYSEKSIVATEDAVMLMVKNTGSSLSMTRISDTVDFSGEYFLNLFNNTKKDYKAQTKWFFPDGKTYAEELKALRPEVDDYILINETGGSVIYTSDGKTKDSYGTFMYSDDTALLSKRYYPGSKSTAFYVDYHRDTTGSILTVRDSQYPTLTKMLKYVEPILKCLPGALSTSELHSQFEDENKVSYGMRSATITSGGISCTINQAVDSSEISIIVKIAEEYIQMPEILSASDEENEDGESQYTPKQSGTLKQLMDGSKNWIGQVELYDWEYNVFFVFEEDGTFYFAIGDLELYGAGVGTYTVSNGNQLSVKCKMSGKKYSVTYIFDPDNFSLTVASNTGLVADKGKTIYLQENTDNDVAQVKGWGKKLAN